MICINLYVSQNISSLLHNEARRNGNRRIYLFRLRANAISIYSNSHVYLSQIGLSAAIESTFPNSTIEYRLRHLAYSRLAYTVLRDVLFLALLIFIKRITYSLRGKEEQSLYHFYLISPIYRFIDLISPITENKYDSNRYDKNHEIRNSTEDGRPDFSSFFLFKHSSDRTVNLRTAEWQSAKQTCEFAFSRHSTRGD